MPTLEFFTSTLKQAGMRLTPQRLAICELLSERGAHPTAVSIYERIRARYPSLALMTVYNTLRALADLGAVNVLGDAGDDAVHYDGNTSPHLNLACVSCHTIADVDSPEAAGLDRKVRGASGFKVLGVRMLVYGLCPDCQEATGR